MVNVHVRFVHVLVNLELTVYHPDRWLVSKLRIGCNDAWVWQWGKQLCVNEGENGGLKNHACPSVLRISRMWGLFYHVDNVSTECPKAKKLGRGANDGGLFSISVMSL